MCVRRGRTCTNCAPGRNGRCENVDAIPSGATTVDPRPELVVADEPAAGEDLMSEVWECEACVGDQAAGNVREENMSEGALLPNNDSPSADSEMRLLPNNHAQAEEFEMNTLAPSSRQHSDAGGMLLEMLHDPHCVTASAIEARPLPPYKPMSHKSSSWQDISGQEFGTSIDDAYSQIVHWIPNLFMLPSGNCGKKFVAELARLFEAYATESPIETFAIKAAMTMPTLLLQKPHAKSKTRDHITCLKRRLELWEKGDLAKLLKEGKSIQNHLRVSST